MNYVSGHVEQILILTTKLNNRPRNLTDISTIKKHWSPTPVQIFNPKYRLDHPEISFFLLSKKMFFWIKASKKTFILILKKASLTNTHVCWRSANIKSQCIRYATQKNICFVTQRNISRIKVSDEEFISLKGLFIAIDNAHGLPERTCKCNDYTWRHRNARDGSCW